LWGGGLAARGTTAPGWGWGAAGGERGGPSFSPPVLLRYISRRGCLPPPPHPPIEETGPPCAARCGRTPKTATLRACEPARFIAFIARETNGGAIGLAAASIRHDYVNGCDTSPVGFLEGIYVVLLFGRRGVAASLVRAAQVRGATQEDGC